MPGRGAGLLRFVKRRPRSATCQKVRHYPLRRPFPLYKFLVTPFVPTLSAMQKTRKSVSKRFKVTGTGKVMRRSPNARHLLSSKSRKQRRRANKSKRVDSGFEKKMLASMPFA